MEGSKKTSFLGKKSETYGESIPKFPKFCLKKPVACPKKVLGKSPKHDEGGGGQSPKFPKFCLKKPVNRMNRRHLVLDKWFEPLI